MEEGPKTRITISIDPEIVRKLKQRAASSKRTVSHYVMLLIERDLAAKRAGFSDVEFDRLLGEITDLVDKRRKRA